MSAGKLESTIYTVKFVIWFLKNKNISVVLDLTKVKGFRCESDMSLYKWKVSSNYFYSSFNIDINLNISATSSYSSFNIDRNLNISAISFYSSINLDINLNISATSFYSSFNIDINLNISTTSFYSSFNRYKLKYISYQLLQFY